MAEIKEAHQVLKNSRVDLVQNYIDRAQKDLLGGFSSYHFGETGGLIILNTVAKKTLIASDLNFFMHDRWIHTMLTTKKKNHPSAKVFEHYVVGYEIYPDWNWLVVVFIEKKEILEARNRFLYQAIFILTGSLAAGILLLIWFNGRVIKPIRQLTVAAESISKGEWNVPLPEIKGKNEVVQLSSIFKKMSRNLAGMYSELKRNLDDIAESREKLRLSREKFRGLVETSSDLIWEVDNVGRYTYISPQVTQLLGYISAELLGTSPDGLNAPQNHQDERPQIKTLLSDGVAFAGIERHLLKKNGETIILESSGVPFFSSQGEKLGFRGIDRDITERKKAAAEQQHLQDQLIQTQKMEAIGRLAGGVAHDFNNMLSVIIGHAEMGLDQLSASDPHYQDFYEIRNAGERSSRLTRHLLAFARKQTVELQVIDLNEVITEMTSMLKRLIGEDIDFEWIPGNGLWQVKLDKSQVDQILANLCVNGRDAISGVGKITIETSNETIEAEYCIHNTNFLPGDYVCLAVSDNGCGMDHETVSRIFEPFFTTKEADKGTGLGLSTIYGILKQNRGFVNVYSEPGQGTTFKLYFRRYIGNNVALDTQHKIRTAPVGTETILLVEDEPAILKMISSALNKNGYHVLKANIPDEAIKLAGENKKIDFLLTDVIMPSMNGRELAELITARHPSIRCLYMSGYTADVIAHHGVLDDNINFISKPFTVKTLLRKIRSILDDTQQY
ncbi:PAS domain S-box protein [Desulfobacter curvatus]|uniref:PAS domain S-box protein n=1 Tax=Desulfobacter curvatus TaxID=2290 RepID=UPI0003A1F54A|nr:PAS domain S-box protein [Desulfobacter curvatus]